MALELRALAPVYLAGHEGRLGPERDISRVRARGRRELVLVEGRRVIA